MSVKKEKKIQFKFEMIALGELLEDENCQKEDCVTAATYFYGNYKVNEYEKYKFIEYLYNQYSKLFKSFSKNFLAYNENAFDLFWSLQKDYLRIIPEIRKYSLSSIENKITEDKSVQDLLKKSMENKGYPLIDKRVLSFNKNVNNIIKGAVEEILSIIYNWLNSQNPNKLKKAFYTENLYRYFDLLKISDEKIMKFSEFLLYSNVSYFKDNLPYNKSTFSKILEFINIKNLNKATLENYKVILFEYNGNSLFEDKGRLDINLQTNVLSGCLREYSSEKEFIEFYLPRLKETTLTQKDFSFIEQYEYIKSLLSNSLTKKVKGINILLYGNPGSGKTALSRVLINDIGAEGYEVSTSVENELRPVDRLHNESVLSNDIRIKNFIVAKRILKKNNNAVILYDEAEDFFRREHLAAQAKGFVNTILEENPTPVIWTTNSLRTMESSFIRRFTYVLNIDNIPNEIYKDIINKIAKKENIQLEDTFMTNCIQYKPTIGIVEKIIRNFKLSGFLDKNKMIMDLKDVLKGQNYGEAIKKMPTNKFSFNPELVNSSEDLIALTEAIKQNGRLDFSLLLYGVPGSSKTSFGRYLAQELKLSVINTTYSELSSMWVGETEKNITQLFERAEAEKSLIILDECDSLLRDRQCAFRSWEVTQTEALLTAMEFHPYPFIMTTNLYDNLDPAVMRRILYKVKHDYLTEEQIKKAFKFFFGINITEKLHLSKLTSGDFAIVKKKAEYVNKLADKDWLLSKLTEEMNQKKALETTVKIDL